eukprot:TRINITY_DN359_c0_g1_i1.p1 TRINITY_DN359_c0_g1~~TRINITY_DN359_c0_g1_i1.p1  ORF type:complete len:441 (+),score=100.58 TRINITY_DN359_c0_g1_i1:88-1410(+)
MVENKEHLVAVKEKSSKNKILLLILLFLLLGGAIGVFLLVGGDDDDSSNTSGESGPAKLQTLPNMTNDKTGYRTGAYGDYVLQFPSALGKDIIRCKDGVCEDYYSFPNCVKQVKVDPSSGILYVVLFEYGSAATDLSKYQIFKGSVSQSTTSTLRRGLTDVVFEEITVSDVVKAKTATWSNPVYTLYMINGKLCFGIEETGLNKRGIIYKTDTHGIHEVTDDDIIFMVTDAEKAYSQPSWTISNDMTISKTTWSSTGKNDIQWVTMGDVAGQNYKTFTASKRATLQKGGVNIEKMKDVFDNETKNEVIFTPSGSGTFDLCIFGFNTESSEMESVCKDQSEIMTGLHLGCAYNSDYLFCREFATDCPATTTCDATGFKIFKINQDDATVTEMEVSMTDVDVSALNKSNYDTFFDNGALKLDTNKYIVYGVFADGKNVIVEF